VCSGGIYVCIYVCMYVYLYIHMYMYMYMYMCMYLHTCYVLTNPPIPSSRCKHYMFWRPNKFLLHKRANPRGSPLVTTLNNEVSKFMMQITE
jgi:hypothetical protein